jgi:hypothetical protein
MSDSPLDGGSGWPTSAYMIVPRQPAAPAQESTAEEPEEAPQELATIVEPSKKGRIAALVVGIIVLIIAAVGGVLATRDTSSPGKSGQPETITSPTVDATTAGPSADPSVDASGSAVPYLGGSAAGSTTPDPSGSPDPGAVVLSPLPENTVILHAGTVWIALLVGRPDDMFDLDAGVKQTAGADISAGALGLTATNGAYFAPWTAVEFPSLAGCSAVPAAQWTTQILLAAPGARREGVRAQQRTALWLVHAARRRRRGERRDLHHLPGLHRVQEDRRLNGSHGVPPCTA